MNIKLGAWGLLAVLVAAWLLFRRRGLDLDLADVKPSGLSFLTVGAMSVVFIVFGKYLTERWYIPGLSEVFHKV